MPKRRCENCSHWSSTDQVWGECLYAGTDADEQRKADARYVLAPGEVVQADLWTRWDFGCVAWSSLAALVKGMVKTLKAGGL